MILLTAATLVFNWQLLITTEPTPPNPEELEKAIELIVEVDLKTICRK